MRENTGKAPNSDRRVLARLSFNTHTCTYTFATSAHLEPLWCHTWGLEGNASCLCLVSYRHDAEREKAWRGREFVCPSLSAQTLRQTETGSVFANQVLFPARTGLHLAPCTLHPCSLLHLAPLHDLCTSLSLLFLPSLSVLGRGVRISVYVLQQYREGPGLFETNSCCIRCIVVYCCTDERFILEACDTSTLFGPDVGDETDVGGETLQDTKIQRTQGRG